MSDSLPILLIGMGLFFSLFVIVLALVWTHSGSNSTTLAATTAAATTTTSSTPVTNGTGTSPYNYSGAKSCTDKGGNWNAKTKKCNYRKGDDYGAGGGGNGKYDDGKYDPPADLAMCANIPDAHKQTFCCDECTESAKGPGDGKYPHCGDNGRAAVNGRCCASISICDGFPDGQGGWKYYHPERLKCEYRGNMGGIANPQCYGGTGGRFGSGQYNY